MEPLKQQIQTFCADFTSDFERYKDEDDEDLKIYRLTSLLWRAAGAIVLVAECLDFTVSILNRNVSPITLIAFIVSIIFAHDAILTGINQRTSIIAFKQGIRIEGDTIEDRLISGVKSTITMGIKILSEGERHIKAVFQRDTHADLNGTWVFQIIYNYWLEFQTPPRSR